MKIKKNHEKEVLLRSLKHRILAGSALLVLSTSPMLSLATSVTVAADTQGTANNFSTQVNPDLTPFSSKLGDDQKTFQSSTKSLGDLYATFTANQTNLNDATQQQAVLSAMATQLTNLQTFISDLQDYVNSNPSVANYPNLVDNLKQYISDLTTYQTNLKTVQADLKAAIDKVTTANKGAQDAYNQVATAYQNLLNTNYANVTNNYNALMKTNTYSKQSQQSANGFSLATGYNPLIMTTSPTYNGGNQTVPTTANITTADNNTKATNQWDSSVASLNSVIANYNTAQSAYQTALVNYQNQYAQTTTVDDSLTALYNTAQSNYQTAQSIYTAANKQYNDVLNVVKPNVDNGYYQQVNPSAYQYLMQPRQDWHAIQEIMATDLSGLNNALTNVVAGKTITVMNRDGSAPANPSTVLNYGALSTTMTSPVYSNVGSFGTANGLMAAYLEQQTLFDYATHKNFTTGTSTSLGGTLPSLNTMFQTPYTAINNASATWIANNSAKYAQNVSNYLTTNLLVTNPILNGTPIGYGLPIYGTLTSKVTLPSNFDTSKYPNFTPGQVINNPIPQPQPTGMDYPTYGTILANANSLLASGNWKNAANTTITQSQVTNWQAALQWIQNNITTLYQTMINNRANAYITYANSGKTPADLTAFKNAVTTSNAELSNVYKLVYGYYSSGMSNVLAGTDSANQFATDLSSLSAQQLAQKYGYRYLLAGMTSTVDYGYYNQIDIGAWLKSNGYPDNTVVAKSYNMYLALGDVGTISPTYLNSAPYLTTPPNIQATVAPPTQPVLQNLSFSETLPTPPDLKLDYEASFISKLPDTGTEGNQLLAGGILGGTAIVAGASSLLLRKKRGVKG